jgi:hypothetical protein
VRVEKYKAKILAAEKAFRKADDTLLEKQKQCQREIESARRKQNQQDITVAQKRFDMIVSQRITAMKTFDKNKVSSEAPLKPFGVKIIWDEPQVDRREWLIRFSFAEMRVCSQAGNADSVRRPTRDAPLAGNNATLHYTDNLLPGFPVRSVANCRPPKRLYIVCYILEVYPSGTHRTVFQISEQYNMFLLIVRGNNSPNDSKDGADTLALTAGYCYTLFVFVICLYF